jgi:hypothetical protein
LTEDHARGLSTFTIMAGLGGFMGYGLGGINWDATSIGIALGGHLHATFTLITFIFIICVTSTLTVFKEMPLDFLESNECKQQLQQKVYALVLFIEISQFLQIYVYNEIVQIFNYINLIL